MNKTRTKQLFCAFLFCQRPYESAVTKTQTRKKTYNLQKTSKVMPERIQNPQSLAPMVSVHLRLWQNSTSMHCPQAPSVSGPAHSRPKAKNTSIMTFFGCCSHECYGPEPSHMGNGKTKTHGRPGFIQIHWQGSPEEGRIMWTRVKTTWETDSQSWFCQI
jgi:hypothetical protein